MPKRWGFQKKKRIRESYSVHTQRNDSVQKARNKRNPVPKSRPHRHFILIYSKYIEYMNRRGWIFTFQEIF